jgi:hypothetical protein
MSDYPERRIAEYRNIAPSAFPWGSVRPATDPLLTILVFHLLYLILKSPTGSSTTNLLL